MPEHDEDDAPEVAEELRDEDESDVEAIEAKRRKSKLQRLGVEDKVVDGETK